MKDLKKKFHVRFHLIKKDVYSAHSHAMPNPTGKGQYFPEIDRKVAVKLLSINPLGCADHYDRGAEHEL